MHLIEQRILNKFKKEPLREIPTTEIVRAAYPEEYSRILEGLKNESHDKKAMLGAMRRKGQLHRKSLYHLNSLVKEGVLKVNSVHGKGEKYFALAMDQGQIVVEKRHRQIVITKPSVSTSMIEEYEQKRIVHKFDPEGWVTKLNCILLESTNHAGINKFYDLVYSCFSEVNDALGLNNFEHLIQVSSAENTEEILKRLDLDTKDHERVISLLINVRNIYDEAKMKEFIRTFSRIKPKNVALIFKIDTKELRGHESLFHEIVSDFSKAEIKLNLHNKKVHDAPIVLGKAGPYTLSEDEWKDYEDNVRGKTIGLALAHTSIAIDAQNFFNTNPSAKEFRELMMRVAKTLLKVSASQRNKSNDYFKRLNELNRPHTKKFFVYAKNYIRFWNYDFEDKRQKNFMLMLQGIKNDIKKFCSTEQTIYKSCGVPFNFDISLSSVFKKFSNNLSAKKYVKTSIRGLQDFSNPDLVMLISAKENLAELFGGGDRMRFFRKENFKPEDITKELTFLMNTYSLPMITYDFKEVRGEMKLTSFMG
jgi:hypothetical protein